MWPCYNIEYMDVIKQSSFMLSLVDNRRDFRMETGTFPEPTGIALGHHTNDNHKEYHMWGLMDLI